MVHENFTKNVVGCVLILTKHQFSPVQWPLRFTVQTINLIVKACFIYLLNYKQCSKQYVGQTIADFPFRFQISDINDLFFGIFFYIAK